MESNFPGIARFAVAQEAMQYLEQNFATFQTVFANFDIPKSDYQLLAGFDEDIIRNRLGYLNQIHIVLRSEPQDMDGFLLSLSLVLKNFTAVIFTKNFKSSYRLPSDPDEFHEIARAETYGISTLSQHADVGGSLNAGGPSSGGNNGGDGPDDSTRKGKERERDSQDPSMPRNSGKEDGEPDPESPGPGSSDARSAELMFQVSADLIQNGLPFQGLQTQWKLEIKRTPESQDPSGPSQFATCNLEFTELRTTNNCLPEENLAYHHFHLDIRIDVLSKLTYTGNIRPLSTPQYNPEAKNSKGVKKAWNALVSGSLSLLPLKATIGTIAGRTGENLTNIERTTNISRIIYREANGIILWKYQLADQFKQHSGFALSPEKLPRVHILFGGDEAAPPSPPAQLNVEIFTYWTILGSASTASKNSSSKPRFSNLCKIINLNLSKDLQGSHLFLSNLLVHVDVNPIVPTVESAVQEHLGKAIVAETEHTANSQI